MSKLDNKSILFLAYSDFNLIELDITNYQEIIHKTPSNLIGSSAMTAYKNKVYFHSPYKDKEGIYEWELGADSAVKIGSYKGNLRGIANGIFLEFKNKEYTIIEMS